jgi:hypothetical protein
VAANLRNRISMQPMKSEGVSWSEGASLLFLWVRSRVVFNFQVVFELWCGDWTVQRSLSFWRVDSWLCIFIFLFGGGVVCESKEFPITPYFYPTCFGKC